MNGVRQDRRALAVLIVLFTISRLLYHSDALAVARVSFAGNLLTRAGQALQGRNLNLVTFYGNTTLLDEKLLREDLWRSLYYLHSQPPLFNLLVAGMLRLPGSLARNYQYLNWLLGILLYLMTFALMRRCGAAVFPATLLTILFMLNPNAMWMEGAVYYGVLVALMLVLATFALYRSVSLCRKGWLAVSLLLFAALVLTRAFFTWIWFFVACAFALYAFSKSCRIRVLRHAGIVAAALLAGLLVVGFQVKQAVVFGQFFGSSWLGTNLAAMTGGMSKSKARELQKGTVSPLVFIPRDSPPEKYLGFFQVPRTGIPALDQQRKTAGGVGNFNHLVYLPVGRQYLRDTLHLVVRNPHLYMVNVVNSIYLFSGFRIAMYFDHPRSFLARWKWYEIVAPLVGFPLIILAIGYGIYGLRRGRWTSADQRVTIVFMVGNIVYILLVACLLEKSEQPLYRHQIDAFLHTLLALGLTDLIQRRASTAEVNSA